MIVLRRKQFAFPTFGAVNIYRALGKGAGATMTAGQRWGQAAMGVGKLGLTGLAVGGGLAAAKATKTTKDALTGDMGKENEANY
jgi:hypothetical protein